MNWKQQKVVQFLESLQDTRPVYQNLKASLNIRLIDESGELDWRAAEPEDMDRLKVSRVYLQAHPEGSDRGGYVLTADGWLSNDENTEQFCCTAYYDENADEWFC